MKKLLLWVVLLCFSPVVWAQNIQITQNSYQKVAVSFETGELSVEDITLPQGTFSMISLPGYGSSYAPGTPEVPQLTKLMQIPVCDSVVATVVNAQYTEYDAAALGIHHPVFPTQATVSKDKVNPPFSYDPLVYHTDAFVQWPLVQVQKTGVKRHVALANIAFTPVQYNPVKNKIRIYTHVDVEFTFVNADLAATVALQKYASPLFPLNRDLVFNKMPETRNEYSAAPIRYMIIANDMFADNSDLARFVAWKRRIGYLVDLVFTSDPGVGTTTTAIKSYIQGEYDNATPANPAPAFLLFIGDREQLPAFNNQTNSDHITDLYYATLSGSDFLPDCYYGRLSATNNQELSNQIEKILMYEQYTMPDPSYLGNAVLIAGTDGNYGPVHANGQINYIYNNYINTDNPAYSNVMVHLYNCSSQAAQIRSEVSAGTGWVNYTAHGSETSWADPSFTTSHVAQLQNTNKYGVMIGNCCQSGNFKTGTCFGEALLRAQQKGAMAYIGASNNSYWGEDYYWAVGYRNNINANPAYNPAYLGMYDKLFHTHNEDYNDWVSTIGGIINGGNMTVQATSSSLKQYYWEIYHCFGDPSVRAYLGVPSPMTVMATPVITTDATSYPVQAAPYAYVALTKGATLIAATFADENGDATITLPADLDPGEYELVAMAQNYIPYFLGVQVINPHGPYVVPIMVEVAENTLFTPGSTVQMNLSLTNVGVSAASQVYARLTPELSSVTMLQDSIYLGSMAVQGVENRTNAFSFQMPVSEDYFKLPFTLHVHWQDTMVTRSVQVLVKLPKVTNDSYRTMVNNVEVQSYNSGDQIQFVLSNKNVGHAVVTDGAVDLTCNYSGVQVLSNSVSINGMDVNTVVNNIFQVKIADTVPEKSLVNLYWHTYYEGVHTIDTLQIMVGRDMETFETGDFSQYDWNMNTYPWVITSSGAYAGTYAARSAQNLPSNSKSSMIIYVSIENPAMLGYYRKVSSEEGYDFLKVYVDGNPVDEASGSVDWTYFSTMLPAGNHSVKFSYEKDYSQSSGQDCAWIDNVALPCSGVMVVEDVVDPAEVGVTTYTVTRATVFPNPTSEYVTVQSEQPVEHLALFDLNGRLVKRVNVGGETESRLDMNDVPSGFYLMQVIFGNQQVQNLKIIKR